MSLEPPPPVTPATSMGSSSLHFLLLEPGVPSGWLQPSRSPTVTTSETQTRTSWLNPASSQNRGRDEGCYSEPPRSRSFATQQHRTLVWLVFYLKNSSPSQRHKDILTVSMGFFSFEFWFSQLISESSWSVFGVRCEVGTPLDQQSSASGRI